MVRSLYGRCSTLQCRFLKAGCSRGDNTRVRALENVAFWMATDPGARSEKLEPANTKTLGSERCSPTQCVSWEASATWVAGRAAIAIASSLFASNFSRMLRACSAVNKSVPIPIRLNASPCQWGCIIPKAE